MRNRDLFLAALPATLNEIAIATGMRYGTAYDLAQSMRDKLHISDWKHHASGSGTLAAVWALGAGPDAPRPESKQVHKAVLAPRGSPNLERVHAALPGTTVELAAHLGLSVTTVRNHLLRLTVAKRAAFSRLERRHAGPGAPGARYVAVAP